MIIGMDFLTQEEVSILPYLRTLHGKRAMHDDDYGRACHRDREFD